MKYSRLSSCWLLFDDWKIFNESVKQFSVFISIESIQIPIKKDLDFSNVRLVLYLFFMQLHEQGNELVLTPVPIYFLVEKVLYRIKIISGYAGTKCFFNFLYSFYMWKKIEINFYALFKAMKFNENLTSSMRFDNVKDFPVPLNTDMTKYKKVDRIYFCDLFFHSMNLF